MAPSPANIWHGVRWNSAFAYLDPVRDRPNLTIVGNALADRVVIDGGRVTGAVVAIVDGPGADRGGPGRPRGRDLRLARRSCSAPASATRPRCRAIGIAPVHALPGVGENLHDHPAAYLDFAGTEELRAEMTAFGAQRWMPEEQTIAKARSSRCPEAFDLHLYPEGGPYAEQRSAWSFIMPIACMTPRSRGTLRLAERRPRGAADPRPRLPHRRRRRRPRVLADGVELGRAITNQPRAAGAARRGDRPGPGRSARDPRSRAGSSDVVVHYYHPVGTCKMGPASDPLAVVDARGKVHGLDGLYVADCSIMPVIPRANTNIPAAVVGERIAGWLATDPS